MDFEKIMEAIRIVLSFNKIVIMSNLMEKPFPEEMVAEVKKACEIIAAAGLYQFNTDCSVSELLTQIEGFIEEGVEESNSLL